MPLKKLYVYKGKQMRLTVAVAYYFGKHVKVLTKTDPFKLKNTKNSTT
jgi:hypothetical protein